MVFGTVATLGMWICRPYSDVLKRLLDIMLDVLGDNLVSVVVFGSVARCEARRDSDIDLLIVVREAPRSRLRRQEMFLEIEKRIERDVEDLTEQEFYIDFSPIIKTVEEAKRFTPLYLDMVEDAVILYDRNNFFKQILDNLRSRLRELGAERVWIGRKWYWRLKKDYVFGEVIEI